MKEIVITVKVGVVTMDTPALIVERKEMTEHLPTPDEHYDDFLVTQIFKYKQAGNKVMELFCQREFDEITSESDGYIIDD